MTDKALRRAGMRYLGHVTVLRHESFAAFDEARRAGRRRLMLLTSHGGTSLQDARFEASDILLLGRESAGVPERVHALADAQIAIPMRAGLRSLNIAVATGMAVWEALRQTGGLADLDLDGAAKRLMPEGVTEPCPAPARTVCSPRCSLSPRSPPRPMPPMRSRASLASGAAERPERNMPTRRA